MKTVQFISCPIAALLLAGCVAPHPPEAPDLPADWNAPVEPSAVSPTATENLLPWWEQLHDAELSSLIDRALENNTDRQLAAARILEARAAQKSTDSSLFPQLNLTGSATRGNNLLETSTRPISLYEAGFDAGYELDLFGRNRKKRQATGADVAAREASYEAVSLTLTAETAREYVTLRRLQNLLDLTRKTIASQQKLCDIVRAKKEGGIVSEFDLSQAETLLKTTRARIPDLERQISATEYQLTTLLGEEPGMLSDELKEAQPVPVGDALAPLDAPVDVIARRPDIQAAEYQLEAATALTGSAIRDLYPKISLHAFLGIDDSNRSSSLNAWSFGADALMPLLNFGRLRGQVHAAEARQTQAFLVYRQSVLDALGEVNTALSNLWKEEQTRQALQNAEESAQKTLDAAHTRYQGGISEFTEVLIAEQQLYDIGSSLVNSEADVSRYWIALCKSLALKAES